MDESTNGRYDFILGKDLLTALVLDIDFPDNVIIGGKGPYEGCSAHLIYLCNYDFTSITDKTVKPEQYFINPYVKKCLEYESTISST